MPFVPVMYLFLGEFGSDWFNFIVMSSPVVVSQPYVSLHLANISPFFSPQRFANNDHLERHKQKHQLTLKFGSLKGTDITVAGNFSSIAGSHKIHLASLMIKSILCACGG